MNHPNQSFVKKHYSYNHYAPAYRVGYKGFTKYEGQDYDDIEDDLAKDYENHRIGSGPSMGRSPARDTRSLGAAERDRVTP